MTLIRTEALVGDMFTFLGLTAFWTAARTGDLWEFTAREGDSLALLLIAALSFGDILIFLTGWAAAWNGSIAFFAELLSLIYCLIGDLFGTLAFAIGEAILFASYALIFSAIPS